MFIYLLRHGIAVQRGTAGYPNDDRPLTDDGKDKMRKGARGIANLIDKIDIILTSPLIRAHDTAKIAAEALGEDHKIEVCKELLPGSSAKKLILYLAKYKNLDHIMIVGHEPDLGFFASALLGSEHSVIEFKKGAICCIEVSGVPPHGSGTLHWHLQPKQLRDLK
ncbi:MAG: phosphohistidine phosphatase SixA [Bacteroidota bacterium]